MFACWRPNPQRIFSQTSSFTQVAELPYVQMTVE